MVQVGGDRLLESLGLSQAEEDVYLHLLREHRATIAELASATGFSASRVQTIVGSLEDKTLIAQSVDGSHTYFPTAPELAIKALAHRRQQEIDYAHHRALDAVRALHDRAAAGSTDVIEIVSISEAFVTRTAQMLANAEEDLMALSRPPFIQSMQDAMAANEQIRPSVRQRLIYDHAALKAPGILDVIEQDCGEEARVLPELPTKLIIVDHSMAQLPLDAAESHISNWVMVRPSAILDTLIALFEALWEQAIPLRIGKQASSSRGEQTENVDEETRKLLGLLSSGLTDEAIARQLGISARSVRRRAADVMSKLHVKTRFQAGLEVERRGWLR